MPETFVQWLWCAFFVIGSLGGWVVLAIVAPILFDEGRRILKQRRAK